MVLPAAYTTADAVRAMPDDGTRLEVVWGELLVTPAPTPAHQRIVVRLTIALGTYTERLRGIETLVSPADISWSDDTLVQPDLVVLPRTEAADGTWRAVRTLLLVIEVLSPSTARHDRFTKRRLYREQGIPTIWLVDSEAGCVEVWTPADVRPVIVRDTLTWRAPGAADALQLEVGELLRGD